MTKSLFMDFYAYASMSSYLKDFGIENCHYILNYFSKPINSSVTPYHYPELWLTAFWSEVFSISTIKSLFFITYPLLLITYLLGLASLFEHSISQKTLTIGISIILLFVTPFIVTFPSFTSIMGFGSKLAFIYIFILLGFILYLNYNKTVGSIIILAIPIFSISFFPSIYIGSTIFFILKVLYQKKLKQENIIAFVIIFLCILCFYIFYILVPNYHSEIKSNDITPNNPFFKSLINNFSFYEFFVFIYNTIFYSLDKLMQHAVPLLIGILPLVIITIKSQIKIVSLWGWCFLMFFGGSIASLHTSHFDVNNFQFITNQGVILVVICILGISICINKYYLSKSVINKLQYFTIFIMIISVMLIPTFIDMYSWGKKTKDLEFLKKVNNSIPEKEAVILTFLKPEYNLLFSSTATNEEIFHLSQLYDKTFIYTLGNPELFIIEKGKNILDLELNYFNNKIPLNVWKNRDTSRTAIDFIKHHNIKYVYLNSEIKTPKYLLDNASQIIKSTITQNTFIILK